MDQSWARWRVQCRHGKDVSRLEPGAKRDVSSDADGFGGKRRVGTVHSEPGAGRVGSRKDPGSVPGGTGISAISSGDDDSGAALQLLPGDLFVTANRESMQTAGGFSGADGDAEAGSSDGEFVSTKAFGGVRGFIPAGFGAVSKSGASETGTRGAGWNANPSECEQAEVDELLDDEENGESAEGGSGAMVGRGGADRPGRR